MLTFEQIKSELTTVNNDIRAARAEGVRLATNKDSTSEQLTAQQNMLEQLLSRQKLLQGSLDELGDEGKKNLKVVKAELDQINEGAKAFRSMGDFFRAVSQERKNPDARLGEYASIKSAATGQNITNDSEGGYLVPPDYAAGLLKFAQSESVLYPKVSRIQIAGNRLIVNRLKGDTRKDTTKDGEGKPTRVGRNGGLLSYWIAEAAEYTAEKLQFEQDQTDLHKLTGLAYATEEVLEDVTAMGGYIAEGFQDEFSFQIDDAILNGSGTGKPLGILDDKNKALVKVTKESGQKAKTITLDNILKMYYAMPARNRSKAEWYINEDVEMVLMQLLLNVGGAEATGDSPVENLKATMGVPLFIPAGGLSGAPYSTLLGKPLIPVEQCAAVGDAGDIVFADMSQYRWIDKGGMEAQTSIHVRFLFDEQAFKFTYRAGGKPIWQHTMEAYRGSTVRSPYVTLAARN